MIAFLKALGLISIFVMVGYWIYGLATWDGSDPCNHNDCDRCPYKCDKYDR